jgi:hypothetical protein
MKELKWLVEYIIEFSDISGFSKDILTDFVNEADELQLLNLLLTGEMVVEVKEENQLEMIKEFKESSMFKLLTEKEEYEYPTTGRKTTMSVLGITGFGLGPIKWAAYRTIRAAFDKCTEKCGTFKINNARRQQCMQKCKDDEAKGIDVLKSKMKK